MRVNVTEREWCQNLEVVGGKVGTSQREDGDGKVGAVSSRVRTHVRESHTTGVTPEGSQANRNATRHDQRARVVGPRTARPGSHNLPTYLPT